MLSDHPELVSNWVRRVFSINRIEKLLELYKVLVTIHQITLKLLVNFVDFVFISLDLLHKIGVCFLADLFDLILGLEI